MIVCKDAKKGPFVRPATASILLAVATAFAAADDTVLVVSALAATSARSRKDFRENVSPGISHHLPPGLPFPTGLGMCRWGLSGGLDACKLSRAVCRKDVVADSLGTAIMH